MASRFSGLTNMCPSSGNTRYSTSTPRARSDSTIASDSAERIAPFVRDLFAEHPRVRDVTADAPGGPRFAGETAGHAMRDLYNPAQLDVIRRAHRLLAADQDG